MPRTRAFSARGRYETMKRRRSKFSSRLKCFSTRILSRFDFKPATNTFDSQLETQIFSCQILCHELGHFQHACAMKTCDAKCSKFFRRLKFFGTRILLRFDITPANKFDSQLETQILSCQMMSN